MDVIEENGGRQAKVDGCEKEQDEGAMGGRMRVEDEDRALRREGAGGEEAETLMRGAWRERERAEWRRAEGKRNGARTRKRALRKLKGGTAVLLCLKRQFAGLRYGLYIMAQLVRVVGDSSPR